VPRTPYDIDKNHCRHYLSVVGGLDRIYEQEGADEAFGTLGVKWANIRAAQAWSASWAASDQEAARYCVGFGRALFSRRTSVFFWLSNQVGMPWSRQAIDSARFLISRDDLAYLLCGLAISGNDEESDNILKYFNESISLFQELGDRHGESYANSHLGHALLKADRLVEAAAAFNSALTIAKEIDRPRQTVHLICKALHGLASLEQKSGNSEAGRDHLAAACKVAAGEGSCLGCEANARDHLSRLLFSSKQYDLALAEAKRAAAIYHLLRDFQDEARMQILVANSFAQLGDLEGFETALNEIERADRDRAEHRNYFSIADAEGHPPMGEPEVLIPSYLAELRYTTHFSKFRNRFERDEFTQALAVWEGWWPTIQPLKNRTQLEAEALGLRGCCHMGLKDFPAAVRAFEQALPLALSIRKSDLVEQLRTDLLLAKVGVRTGKARS
jgi:tetratricopeptide (TPR) repeat protein